MAIIQTTHSQVSGEFEGQVKITQMNSSSSDSIMVYQPNGILAIRDASTITEYQLISISNDTIFLDNGGFVKLPQLNDDDPLNEIQNISSSKTGDTLHLSNGGFLIIPGISSANPYPECIPDVVANVSNIMYGEICGAPLSYTIDVSNNIGSAPGLWQDIVLEYDACLSSGMSIASILVNGTALNTSHYSVNNSMLTLDFTSNTDALYGLTDEDADGFMDDLLDGQQIVITTNIEFGCLDDLSYCTENIDCSLDAITLNGTRNCDQSLSINANFGQSIDFFYGDLSHSTNATVTSGYNIPITEVITTTCNVWIPSLNGYEFSYEFDINNIGGCISTNGITLRAYVQADGTSISDIRFNNGSATYQGNPVPNANSYYDIVNIGGGILDTIGLTIDVPAGDPSQALHDYFFNLEFRGDCHADDYVTLVYTVLENCNSCSLACDIVRSCDTAASFVEWNGCGCPPN